MSKTYLITLTPIDKFFFGGEITFTRDFKNKDKESRALSDEEKDLRKFDEEFSSYVVRSNLFPQQTSLLGMLRFLLLSNSGEKIFKNNKIQDADGAKGLIGEKSFQIEPNDFGEMDFGKIKNLSPCFLRRKTTGDWENIFYAPFDKDLNVKFEKGNILLDVGKSQVPDISYKEPKNGSEVTFNQKDGIESLYFGNNSILKEKDIFLEDTRIGIDRNFEGKTQDGAFYKQISYRLTNKRKISKDKYEDHKLQFALKVEVDDDCTLPQKSIVSIGGDNSQFSLESKHIENTKPDELFPVITGELFCSGKVVLISDAFIDEVDLSNCMFAINDTVPFRFLKSDLTTQDYYKFSGKSKLLRSEKKFLYTRGSVFYFETEEQITAFEKALKAKSRLYQIGYNYYKTIKQ